MTPRDKTHISSEVQIAVFNSFSSEFQSRAVDALSKYGSEKFERDKNRVQLAIVKLCKGDIKKLENLVTTAQNDYRDILYREELNSK